MCDNDLILEKVKTLQQSVDALTANTATRADLDRINTQVQKHEVFIKGNGKVGAETKIALMETSLEEFKSDLKQAVDNFNVSLKKEIEAAINSSILSNAKLIVVPIIISVILGIIQIYMQATPVK